MCVRVFMLLPAKYPSLNQFWIHCTWCIMTERSRISGRCLCSGSGRIETETYRKVSMFGMYFSVLVAGYQQLAGGGGQAQLKLTVSDRAQLRLGKKE